MIARNIGELYYTELFYCITQKLLQFLRVRLCLDLDLKFGMCLRGGGVTRNLRTCALDFYFKKSEMRTGQLIVFQILPRFVCHDHALYLKNCSAITAFTHILEWQR